MACSFSQLLVRNIAPITTYVVKNNLVINLLVIIHYYYYYYYGSKEPWG